MWYIIASFIDIRGQIRNLITPIILIDFSLALSNVLETCIQIYLSNKYWRIVLIELLLFGLEIYAQCKRNLESSSVMYHRIDDSTFLSRPWTHSVNNEYPKYVHVSISFGRPITLSDTVIVLFTEKLNHSHTHLVLNPVPSFRHCFLYLVAGS